VYPVLRGGETLKVAADRDVIGIDYGGGGGGRREMRTQI